MKKLDEIYFKFPTTAETLFANNIYDKALTYFKNNKYLSKEDINFYIKKYGIMTKEEEAYISDIEHSSITKYPRLIVFDEKDKENRYIENCMIEIIHGYRKLRKQDLFKREDIDVDLVKYRELLTKKSIYLRHSSESLAESIRLNYLTYFCTYKNQNEKLWGSYSEFLNENPPIYVKAIQYKLVDFLSGFNMTILRRIARHPLWRTRWIAATKTGASLFAGNISGWDLNKSLLVYWSNFYDSVYSGYKTPEKHIVDDDELLDNWLEQEERNAKMERPDDSNKDGIRAIFKNNIAPIKRKK